MNKNNQIEIDSQEDFEVDYGELDELEKLLAKKYVCFSFYKINGDLRKAYGTRNSKKLITVDAPIPRNSQDLGTLPFFDLEDLHWKSISYRKNKRPRVRIIETYDTVEEMIQYAEDEGNFKLLIEQGWEEQND